MAIPANIIIIWSGSTSNIPEGWLLCDGTNGTPDLRERFVVGAGNTYAVGNTGGSADAILPTHNHTTSNVSTTGAHTHGQFTRQSQTSNQTGVLGNQSGGLGSLTIPTNTTGAHTHSLTTTEVGEDPTNKNLPPYYALAYIMSGGA